MTAIQRFAALASLLIVTSALGEGDRVCMGGEIEQLSATQLHACQSQVQQVREAAAEYHTGGWHFIVVCDESGWSDYASFSQTSAIVLAKANADTNVALHTTFFRGSHLNEQLGRGIVATEMATISRESSPQQVAANR